MSTTLAAPDPGDDDEETNIDATDEEPGEADDGDGTWDFSPIADQADFKISEMLRNVSKIHQPNLLLSDGFLQAIRHTSPLAESMQNAAKAVGAITPTYDLSPLSALLEELKPKYNLASALAAENILTRIDPDVLGQLIYRPPLAEIPPVLAGALYSARDVTAEDSSEDDEAGDETDDEGADEDDADTIADLVRRDFDTGELSDAEIDSTVEQGVAEYQALSEDAKAVVSGIADLMQQIREDGKSQIAQTAMLIKIEEQKIEVANKRAAEAEEQARQAEEREARIQKLSDSRGRVQTFVSVVSAIGTILSLIVAIIALQ